VTPPRLARRIVGSLAPREVRDVLLDDLAEAFERRATRDAAAARRWYRRQAFTSVPTLIAMRLRSRRDVHPPERAPFAMDTIRHDLRYALRLLRRSPGFALAAVATIALGIGANTAILSVVHGLLLKPLPYPDSDRVVMLWQDMRARGGPADEWATPGNFADWNAERSTFASIAAIGNWAPTLTGDGTPEPLTGEQVTPEYFDVLGAAPIAGRFFRTEDGLPNAPRVVVLGRALWARRFGADAGVIGRSVVLAGEPHEIVGIAPAGVRPIVNQQSELWRPLRLNLATPSRGAIVLRVAARLQPQVTVDRANASMAALAKRLEPIHPEFNTGVGFVVEPLHERVVGQVRPGVLVLFGAVILVLLVACVNIANLLLARSSGRMREMAVRAALGAGRRRVIRQLLTESLLLSTIGGIAGVLLAYWGVRALVAMAPAGTPRLDEIGLDPVVLSAAAGLTLITGVLFGLVPALQLSGRAQQAGLREGVRGSAGAVGRRLRRALIVTEVAAAFVLLVGGGLLLRSFTALQRVDLGFDPENRLVAFVPVAPAKYRADEARIAFQDRLLERVAALPGVDAAAISSIAPLDIGDSDMGFQLDGAPVPGPTEPGHATWYRVVSSGYFDALGISIVKGRAFEPREPAPAVVVNETFVRRHSSDADPVGRRLRFSPDGQWFTIVGVAEDVKQRGARGDDRVQSFLPYWQFPELAGGTNVVLKTAAAPESMAPALARAVRDIDADVPVARLAPLSDRVKASIEEPAFLARITGGFAALALLLAALGVYGVMSYAVTQRLPEMGVRLALGARPSAIFRMVFADGLRLTAIGLALGVAAAIALGPVVEAVLFGVPARDPVTFAVTTTLLLGAAAVATFVPARRATAVDPADTLRST
jgi:putative ABC transport system permease protein